LRLQQQPAVAERRHAPEFRALVHGRSECMSRNPDEPARRLDHGLGHCREEAGSVVQSDGRFATNARHLYAFAISGWHTDGDDAGLREENLAAAITRLPKHGSFPKIMLPQMLMKKSGPLRRDEVLIRRPVTTWRRVVLCLEEIR
jgi:hypothetical protein